MSSPRCPSLPSILPGSRQAIKLTCGLHAKEIARTSDDGRATFDLPRCFWGHTFGRCEWLAGAEMPARVVFSVTPFGLNMSLLKADSVAPLQFFYLLSEQAPEPGFYEPCGPVVLPVP